MSIVPVRHRLAIAHSASTAHDAVLSHERDVVDTGDEIALAILVRFVQFIYYSFIH